MEDKLTEHLFGIYSRKTDSGTYFCKRDGSKLSFYQRVIVLIWLMLFF